MIPEEVSTLLDIQRKCFDDAIARLQHQFIDHVRTTEKRIVGVISSLEFSQAKLEEEKAKHQREIDSLQQHLTDTTLRLDYLDDQSRRNNLRFT